MPKVSVIIAVYGAEKYIEKCARSLFEQTLNDIEYIFVDDCTPDKSMDILISVLSDYPNRKNQVKIIHNETNLKQGRTRAVGILSIPQSATRTWAVTGWLMARNPIRPVSLLSYLLR